MNEGYFYRCDPKLNKECKKSNCFINGGECENTIYKEYALESLLKVGDYVRTKNGLIAKYIGYDNEVKWHLFDGKIQWYYEYYRDDIDDDDWEEFKKEDVIKSSPNIIDLIKPGDYVNGSKVIRIEESSYVEDNKKLMVTCEGSDNYNSYFEEEIKLIVTKEQFENMKYNVKEKE